MACVPRTKLKFNEFGVFYAFRPQGTLDLSRYLVAQQLPRLCRNGHLIF